MEVVTLFVNFYKSLDTQSLSELKNIYSDDVVFIDPVTEHKGFAAVHRYFEQLLVDVNECTFDISQIKAGKLISVEGISQLIVKEQKICNQRDYYDLGSMLYEQVPLLGTVIKYLKKRLAS